MVYSPGNLMERSLGSDIFRYLIVSYFCLKFSRS